MLLKLQMWELLYITKAEMLRGRIEYLIKAENSESLLRAQEFLFRTEEFLAELLIVPISQSAADEFERLRIVSKLIELH